MYNNEEFQKLMEECNKIKDTNYVDYKEYCKIFHQKQTELISYITIDLTESKTAYYICGVPYFDICQVNELLSSVFDRLDYQMTFPEWFIRFNQGTLTDLDIKEIYHSFELINECGSLFTYANISLKDNILERIQETEKRLYYYAKEDGTDVTDEMIKKEAMCYFYLQIGLYYFYGINLDCPFD